MSLLLIIPLGFCGLMIMNVIVPYTDAALNVHCLYLVSPCFLFFFMKVSCLEILRIWESFLLFFCIFLVLLQEMSEAS